ncbi:WD40-repeat-containing domain protein [Xylaria palmicola]|nr:WD40-repeat-containing domain protein [Xylaria palmicola]
MAAPPGRLHREDVLAPITALAFLTLRGKRYLLAAEDTAIQVYDVAASRLCASLPVFRAQPIHGISVPPPPHGADDDDDHVGAAGATGRPPRILVWGGHTVKVLPGHVVEALLCAGEEEDAADIARSDGRRVWIDAVLSAPEAMAPDWIFDGRISPFDGNHVVLLTAHNEVIQGCVSADGYTLILGRVRSPSRPILYSGNFFWVRRDCVLVAAGTVFGEIVVWKCHLDSTVDTDDQELGTKAEHAQVTAGCEVLFIFSGHEGSIFGVHISPEILTSSGETIRLLASCSDDRTIRIWDITERGKGSADNRNGYETQISGARETGFGDSIVGSIGRANDQSRCVAMAMGHVSRIWQVEIKSPVRLSRGDLIEVYSFGEDATMQRWHLELDAGLETTPGQAGIRVSDSAGETPAKLTHHETFANHSGKQIWSHAMVYSENGLLVATGGADGKIALIQNDNFYPSKIINGITEGTDHYPRSIEELDVPPASLIERCHDGIDEATLPDLSFKHGNGKETFQSFTFITGDRLLVTTRSGRVFVGSFGSKTQWKELTIPEEIKKTIQSYTIIRSSRRASTAFIGAPNGELFYYHEGSGDSLQPFYKAERKITDIICLSDILPSAPRKGGNSAGEHVGCIEILITVFGSAKAELLRLGEKDRTILERTEITVPADFIVTTAAWCHDYLILGSRNGSMAIFDPATQGTDSPVLTMKVKISDKITSILPLPRRSEDSPLYFLTTARDGKYRIYELADTANTLRVRLLHETRPPFGPMIEGSWLVERPDGGLDLVLYGFRGRHFVVWNATRQGEVAAMNCGGGHRVFDQARVAGNPEGVRFACTKASRMRVSSQARAPHRPLRSGGHGREIKAASASAAGRYVATGAEDTVIRLWERRGGGGPMRCVLALERHNTGIQKLMWSGDQHLFSSGGNEEFFVWRVAALESDACPLGVVCEAVFPDRSEAGDLRITDFDVRCLAEDDDDDDEAGVVESGSGESPTGPRFCISMALSNSTVRSYLYSARRGFQLLGRRAYTGACLTQLRHLGFADGCRPQVLTTATDGHLAVFTDIRSPGSGDESESTTDVLVAKLHQSTVKSLDMRSIATEAGISYLVVTGGDDDAIGVLHLHRSSSEDAPGRYEVRNKSIVRSAHAAAVTGVGIVRLERSGRDAVVVTASNDQRVKTWRLVDWQSASPSVHLLDNRYSGVADAGDLEVVEGCSADEAESPLSKKKGAGVLVAGVGIETWDVF